MWLPTGYEGRSELIIQRSRFLTDAVCETCELVTVSDAKGEDQPDDAKAKGDIRARVRSRWG